MTSRPDLDALKLVAGGFNVQSTDDIKCEKFDSEHGEGKTIQGPYVCKSATSNPKPRESGTSTGGAASPSKTNAANPSNGLSEVVGGLSFVGALLQMLL